MSVSARVTYPCGRCAQPVEVELHKSFVIDSEAALRAITESRFHVLACARCGEMRPFEVDFLVTNQARDLFVQVVTRDADVAAMAAAMRSMTPSEGQVHARIVASRNQLVDKVRLWSQRLDDVAVEVVKHFIRLQIKDLAGTTQSFFERITGDDLVFATISPDRPMQATTMSLEVYRTVIRELDTAAYAGELEVDGRLAKQVMDRKLAAKAAAAAAPPTTTTPKE